MHRNRLRYNYVTRRSDNLPSLLSSIEIYMSHVHFARLVFEDVIFKRSANI